jgi:hypothetical protein
VSLSYRTTLAVLMFLTGSANSAVAHSSSSPNLQVSVFNRAQVPGDKLMQAEVRAEKIMSHAGIRLTWLNCPVSATAPGNAGLPSPAISKSCQAIQYPEHVAITILDHPRNATADTFGQAFLNAQGTGSYIDVYYDRLSALRAEEPIAPAEILGYVIAHEIGHLELGADSHSKTGLMRAHWDTKSLSDAAKGQLLFSASQIIAMQTTLSLASQSTASQTMTSQKASASIAPDSVAQAGMP